jgi:hypothetical protein
MNRYLVKVLYISLFEMDSQPTRATIVVSDRNSKKVLRDADRDVRTTMVGIDRLATVVSNGFDFMLLDHSKALDMYKETHNKLRELDNSREIKRYMSRDDDVDGYEYEKYTELLRYILEKYETYIGEYRTGNVGVKRGLKSHTKRRTNRKEH